MICPKCKANELKEVVLFTSTEKHCAYCNNTLAIDTTSKTVTVTLFGSEFITLHGSDVISVCSSLDSVKKEIGKYALLNHDGCFYSKWVCDGENWWKL